MTMCNIEPNQFARGILAARRQRLLGSSGAGFNSLIVVLQVRHSNRSKRGRSSRVFLLCMAMPQIGQ